MLCLFRLHQLDQIGRGYMGLADLRNILGMLVAEVAGCCHTQRGPYPGIVRQRFEQLQSSVGRFRFSIQNQMSQIKCLLGGKDIYDSRICTQLRDGVTSDVGRRTVKRRTDAQMTTFRDTEGSRQPCCEFQVLTEGTKRPFVMMSTVYCLETHSKRPH